MYNRYGDIKNDRLRDYTFDYDNVLEVKVRCVLVITIYNIIFY